MKPFPTLWRWLRSLGQRGVVKQEIDEELRFHIEQRTAENIAAGMSSEDAAREARKRFGNLQSVREECRDVRGAGFGEATLQDARFGLRTLRKNPGFAAIAVLTLALGVGATSTVFDLVQGVLLTPPAYAKPQQLVAIAPARVDGQPCQEMCTGAQWSEWQKAKSFEAIVAFNWGFQVLVLPDGSESVEGLFVTPNYFQMLGIKPLLGRALLPSDVPPPGSGAKAIVLGYNLWQRRFNADRNVIGKTVHLTRREPLTVVGVMPEGVRFLPAPADKADPNYEVDARVDFWIPLWLPDLAKPDEHYCHMLGRLRDGATLAGAETELKTIAARQAQANHDLAGMTAHAELLMTQLNREGNRLLLPLMGAVTLVFLVASGNVAGLLLARGIQRRQEYAMRCALGASRMRLFRQVLTESAVLSLLGGAAGAAIAVVTVKVLKATSGSAIPRLDAVTVGWPVLLFCLALAGFAAVLAGLIPAWRASGLDPVKGVTTRGTSSAGGADRRLLSAVAMLQTALTVALLIGAGLLIRTVHNLASVRPGFDTENILTLSVVSTREDWYKFNPLERVAALPDVRNVAFGWGLPLTGNKWVEPVEVEGAPTSGGFRDHTTCAMRSVSPDYFDLMGLKMIDGRGFRAFDNPDNWRDFTKAAPGETPLVVIINQAMAERYFPNTNPLGKSIRAFPWRDRPSTVVGIVVNSRSEALNRPAEPEMYYCYLQMPVFSKHLIVRTRSDPRLSIAAIERELRSIEPSVAIENVKTMEQVRNDSIVPQLFAMRLLTGFSILATLLALIGIYGVLSLSVAFRRREIAIRMAMGAQRREVLGLFLGEGLKLIAVGLVVGTGLAIALTQLLRTFLFGVEPTDPPTFAGVAILFAAVALLACYIPARRAMKADPMTALRCE